MLRQSLFTFLPVVKSCVAAALLFAVTFVASNAFGQKPVGSQLVADAKGATVAAVAKAGEWPEWRGPQRDGISTEKGLLKSWPENGPPLAWKVEGLGSGFSSVSIAGGKIFTMGKKKDGVHMLALNVADGQELWSTRVCGGGDPNCTPTVDGNLVYGVGFDGDLVCCETATGKIVWQKNFGKDFGGKMMSGWGYSESPLIDGDLLICTPGANDAILAALNKRTGEVKWKTAMPKDVGGKGGDGAAYSSVVISHGAGVKQYVQLVGRGVIGADAKTGKLLWGYNAIANGTANIPTPIVKGDYIFCSTGYGTGSALVQLSKKGDEVVAKEIYFLDAKTMQNHHGGMILLGDYVYCGHRHNEGYPLCVEMKTGKVVWGGETRGAGTGSAAIAYADGHFYFRYQNGTMALIEATPKEYKLKGQFELASKIRESWPHPVIAGGKLYVRDQGVMMCYDVRAK